MHPMTNHREPEQRKASDRRHDQIVKAAVRLFSERGYFRTMQLHALAAAAARF
jgi:AcrR family transcriptional regulator